MNATITKIELVNGSSLSFTLALPAGRHEHDFDLSALGGELNTIMDGSTLVFNTFETETDLAAGDQITPEGDIIEGNTEQPIEATELVDARADHRDAFAEKHNGQF